VYTVLRQRNFSLLWWAGLISFTGDWMLAVALPLTVYELTGSPLATGGVLIANKVTALVLGSVAGVFVDRWDRQHTMVVANLLRIPILAPLLVVDSAAQMWIVYLVAAGLSAVGQFFRPAEHALLPLLVGADHVVPANAANALNDNLGRLIGPALGGLTVAWLGLGGVAAVDGATYLIAAGLLGMIGTATSPDKSPPATRGIANGVLSDLGHEWRAGLHLIWGNMVLRIVFLVFAIASLGEGVMQTAFWIYIDHALGGGSRVAGWLLSAQAVGGLVGGATIGLLGRARSPLALLGWGAIGMGITDLVLFNYPAVLSGIWLGLVTLAVGGVPGVAFGTGYTAAVQLEAADAYRGRIFGALLATSALLMIVGAAIAGLATERFGAVTVLSIDSFGYIGGGLVALAALQCGATCHRWRAKQDPHPGGADSPRH
jgi:Na+/melibiose symporter-like transporter